MNKQRRKELDTIANEINNPMDQLRECKDDEEMYYYEIPENLKQSDRGG